MNIFCLVEKKDKNSYILICESTTLEHGYWVTMVQGYYTEHMLPKCPSITKFHRDSLEAAGKCSMSLIETNIEGREWASGELVIKIARQVWSLRESWVTSNEYRGYFAKQLKNI